MTERYKALVLETPFQNVKQTSPRRKRTKHIISFMFLATMITQFGNDYKYFYLFIKERHT